MHCWLMLTSNIIVLKSDVFLDSDETLEGPIGVVARMEAEKANNLLTELHIKVLNLFISRLRFFCFLVA